MAAERLLYKLFDYQKFSCNERLERVIQDTIKRQAAPSAIPISEPLSDEALDGLAAAGDFSQNALPWQSGGANAIAQK